jgi:putative thymidine phosphorylase
MKFKVKDMDIATGGPPVVILNVHDANLFDLHHMDRVLVRRNGNKTIAVLNIAESSKAVRKGHIGLMEEALHALRAKSGQEVKIELAKKPESISLIKKKLEGSPLNYADYLAITKDIVSDRLTSIELTAFVLANYTTRMSMKEIVFLTRAMRDTGSSLKVDRRGKKFADLHSIGGVPGNRTTPIVVAILIAAGLLVPKTSSRAITSPAGTADTMEVLCPVSIPIKKLEKMLTTVGGFLTWGGAVNLAPADDKIIRVERPLSIDAEGQMLASIMAKKASVGSTHLLIEIPMGAGAKVADRKRARHLDRKFKTLGKFLGIKVTSMITDGSQPIGHGIGPVLEIRDCLRLLMNDDKAPKDLRKKSLIMAGKLLEFTGKSRSGVKKATELLESGAALDAFDRMVRAQGGKLVDPEKLKPGCHTFMYKASKAGRVSSIDNIAFAHMARVAGAPKDKAAGIDLHVHRNYKVKKGQPIFTIHAVSKQKLKFALQEWKKHRGIVIK